MYLYLDLMQIYWLLAGNNIYVKNKYLFLAYTAHVEYATAAGKGLINGWHPVILLLKKEGGTIIMKGRNFYFLIGYY